MKDQLILYYPNNLHNYVNTDSNPFFYGSYYYDTTRNLHILELTLGTKLYQPSTGKSFKTIGPMKLFLKDDFSKNTNVSINSLQGYFEGTKKKCMGPLDISIMITTINTAYLVRQNILKNISRMSQSIHKFEL